MAIGKTAGGNIMSSHQRLCAELARRGKEIVKLDRAVALDARHRRLAANIAVGKAVDHRFTEAVLVIQHVVRNADPLGDVARIMDVLPGAAGTLAMDGRAV